MGNRVILCGDGLDTKKADEGLVEKVENENDSLTEPKNDTEQAPEIKETNEAEEGNEEGTVTLEEVLGVESLEDLDDSTEEHSDDTKEGNEQEDNEEDLGALQTEQVEQDKEGKTDNKSAGKPKKWLAKAVAGAITVAAVIVLIVYFVLVVGPTNGLVQAVDNAQEKNAYMQLMIGPEQYVYLLYNKDGEAIAESNNGGTAFYRKDNKIVTVGDDEVIIDYDLNPLEFIRRAIDVANDNKSEGKGCTITQEEKDENQLYVISIKGKENIEKIYSSVDKDFAKESMEMLYTGFKEDIDTELIIKATTGPKGELGALCEVAFGDDVYTSWVFDGYIETFEWELGNKWYSNNKDDVKAWVELASSTVGEISSKMAEFMQTQNIESASTKTGGIDYAQYKGKTNKERLSLMADVVADLNAVGYAVTCDVDTLVKAIDAFYSEGTENQSVNVLQAALNAGTAKGWLVQQASTEEIEGTQDKGNEQAEGTNEQAEGTNEQAEGTNKPVEGTNVTGSSLE